MRYAALLLALPAAALAAPQEQTIIRTTTNLVEVRVVAQDSHHIPVADLQRSDFEIFDNGKAQPIRLFSAYRGAATMRNPAAAASGDSPTPSEYAVLLLDWMNATYFERIFVRDEALRLIKSYQPRQRLAVFVLSRSNPRLLHGFSYDRDTLAHMVENLDLDWGDQLGPARDQPIGGLRGSRGGRDGGPTPDSEFRNFNARNQLVKTSMMFEEIADRLMRVPGRKALLWVSMGIPMTIDGSYYAPFLEPAIHKLNRSDVAIYAIDAHGFDDHPSDSLFSFAERTGGLTFYLSNDLADSMRQALEDFKVSYTIGFHMPEGAKKGPHAITVRVKRPGVRLRYRESYDPSPGR